MKHTPNAIFNLTNQQERFSKPLKLFSKVACGNNATNLFILSPNQNIIMINYCVNR